MHAVTSPAVSQVLDFVDQNHDQHDALLAELLRIPSVSADSKFAPMSAALPSGWSSICRALACRLS